MVGTGVVADTSATLAGTIVAQNSCSGPIVDDGYNIDDTGTCGLHASGSVGNSSALDSYLGTLSDNGGATETIPLLASPASPAGPDPALNVIPSSFALPSGGPAACSVPDQRGVSRIAPCDMGAYETHPADEATTTQPAGSPTTVVQGGSVPFTATATPNPTAGVLTASSPAPDLGGTVTYTAMVSPLPDAGSVAFSDSGSPIACGEGSTDLTNGVATCNVTYTAAGSHTVIATYSGDTAFGSSVSSPVVVGVAVAPTTTSLTESNTTPAVGDTVTYAAMVSPMPDAGSVAFSDNGSPVTCEAGSNTLATGLATCTVTYSEAGSHTVSAAYSGDTAFGPSVASPVGVGVGVAPTTISLTVSNTAPAVDGMVTYTAMVSPLPDAGSVVFSDNGSPVTCGPGSIVLTNGVAACNVTYTAAGTHTVIATYSGAIAFGPSVSNTTSHAVAIGAG
jgi:hypothetical protein